MSTKISFHLFAYWHDPRWRLFVGASVKFRDLAINLAKEGHDVVLFLPKYGFTEMRLPVTVIETPLINVPGLRSISYNVLLCCYLLFHWRSLRPDIVYLRRTTLIVPLLYARLKRVKFFFEVNDDPFAGRREEGNRIKFRLRTRLSESIDRTNIRVADRCFVISQAVIEKIKRNMPAVPLRKMKVMPSGANTDLMRPVDRSEACQRIGIDGGKHYIGFVGSLLSHQGLEYLVEAALSVVRVVPTARFMIVGEGPMKHKLVSSVVENNLGTHFIFTGGIDYERLYLWINAMDVCVAPYVGDAGLRSPVKIFDYLACGKPVVASDVDGITGVFKDAPFLTLIPPDSPGMLASRLCQTLALPALTPAERTKIHRWVADRFDRSLMTKMVAKEAAGL